MDHPEFDMRFQRMTA